jgi:hypothetical protein
VLNNEESISFFNFLRENKKRTPKMVFDLAEMYYRGIDERVNPKGYIQKGVNCNEKLALKYYYQLISNKEYRDISIFRIAEIYRNSEKLKNLEKSKKLYLLLLKSDIIDLKMNAFERIQSINTELELPLLQDLVSFEENFNIRETENVNVNVITPQRFITDSIRNDSQNVHDSTVVKTMKNKLNSLKELYQNENEEIAIKLLHLLNNCIFLNVNLLSEPLNKSFNEHFLKKFLVRFFKLGWWNAIDFVLKMIQKSCFDKSEIEKKENEIKSKEKISKGILKANDGKCWGKAILIKNFKEEIQI